MLGSLGRWSPRSHFKASQTRKHNTKDYSNKATPQAANSKPEVKPPDPEPAQLQPEDVKPEEPQNNTGNRAYEAQIAYLNKKTSSLNGKLDIKARKQRSSKLDTERTTPKASARKSKKGSKDIKAEEERFHAFKDEIDKREQLEQQRYSKVGFYLQLFAEWTLTQDQRKNYNEELDRVNVKRRAEGKSPK